MNGRWILTVALLALAGGFWLWCRLIKKDTEKAGDSHPFKGKERWSGMGQLTASTMGMSLLIPPFTVTKWGWAPALAAAVAGGIIFGAAQNLTVSGWLMEKDENIRNKTGSGNHVSLWKSRLAAAAVWLFAVFSAAAIGHTIASSFKGFVQTESGEWMRNSVGAAGAASCVILCVAAAGVGIVCRYRKVSRPVKVVAVCLVILDSAWLGKTYPIYFGQTVWLAVIFLLTLFSVLIPFWAQARPRGQILLALSAIVLAAGCLGIFWGNPQPEGKAMILPASPASGFFSCLSILLWGVVSGFDAEALAVSPLRYQKDTDFRYAAVGSALLKSLCAVVGLLMSFAFVQSEVAEMGLEEAPQFFAASAANLLAKVGIPYDFTIALFLMAGCSFLLTALDTAVRTGTQAFRDMTRRTDGKYAGGRNGWTVGAVVTLLLAFAEAMLAEHLSAGIFAAASFAAVLLLLLFCGFSLNKQGRRGWILWIGALLLLAAVGLSWLLPAM